jgi:hypothetical protein
MFIVLGVYNFGGCYNAMYRNSNFVFVSAPENIKKPPSKVGYVL